MFLPNASNILGRAAIASEEHLQGKRLCLRALQLDGGQDTLPSHDELLVIFVNIEKTLDSTLAFSLLSSGQEPSTILS